MKIFSKCTLAIVLAAFFTQTSFAQAAFGAKIGGNFANIRFSDDSGEDIKALLSFNAGLVVEAPISGMIGLRSGLEVQGKGFKAESTDAGDTFKGTFNPIYVQVPIVLGYNASNFFIGAGPFLAVGVAGKTKFKATGTINLNSSENIKFGSKEDSEFSRVDYGARIEAAYKANKFRISVNYDLGFGNVIPKDLRDGESAKNGVFALSLGYMF